MSNQIKFRVFQDPTGTWDAWDEETFRIAQNNHREYLRASGNEFSFRMLDCLAKAVVIYAESPTEAIKKGKTLK